MFANVLPVYAGRGIRIKLHQSIPKLTKKSIASKPVITSYSIHYTKLYDRAKQYVPCNYDGQVIGDGILFHLEPNRLLFVGRAPTANWLQFHAETGGYNVAVEKDDRSPGDPKGRAVIV